MQEALRFQVHPGLEDPVLVLAFAGWNDASEAATGTVQFLNDALVTAPLAEIDSEDFYDFTVARPHLSLEEGRGRRLVWPGTEFRYGQRESVDFVTALGTEPHMRWSRFCDSVMLMADTIGAQRVVLLGSYLADVVYSRPVDVSGFATDPAILDKLDVVRSVYEGPTGIIGVLSERLQSEGRELLSMWAGLPHYLNTSPNPRGTLALVEKLGRYAGVSFDESELRVQAEEFEKQVNDLVAADPELADYVKQLKRRDFGQ